MSAAMQTVPQHARVHPATAIYQASQSSPRHYNTNSSQAGEPGVEVQSNQHTPQRQNTRGGSATVRTPQSQLGPPPDIESDSMSTPRAVPLPPSAHASPASLNPATASPSFRSRSNRQEPVGPPIPPPRTSSNHHSNGRERTQRPTTTDYASGNSWNRSKDDAARAAVAARSRRGATSSPDKPQRSASTREGNGRKGSNANTRSATNFSPASSNPVSREPSSVINRMIVTDPQVDLDREKERLAEAKAGAAEDPETPPGTITVDSTRGSGRSRQDHSHSKRKETKFGDYILGQTLGEGEFGKVRLGWKLDGSVQVAIKLIRRDTLGTNPGRLPKIYREISILRTLSHPNIVRLHEMVETDRHIGIILEYASGGELFDYILNHRYLKDGPARRLFAQLVSGVGYLHKKGIVHRDLKLENLLLDRNRNIIITDFGFANTFEPNDELGEEIEYNLTNKEFVKKMDLERPKPDGHRRGDLMQTSCGSPCYAAPELVYAMLAGYLPFDDDPANPEGDNINLLYKYIVSTPLTFPEYVTPHARDLLRRILVPDPRKRADLFEVARHSWLSDYAHVVSHITSSTTTVGEIANTTVTAGMTPSYTMLTSGLVKKHEKNHDLASLENQSSMGLTQSTEDQQEAPLLNRSASVREPSRAHPSNRPSVGGLNHQQGKVADEEPSDKQSKRDPKRRTVQVEYVAPQSQTAREHVGGTPSQPPVASSSAQPKTRSRGAHNAVRQGTLDSKPLPPEPKPAPVPKQQTRPVSSGIPLPHQQKQSHPQPNMPPPTRSAREVPRSVSDSQNAFGFNQTAPLPSARPTTQGSVTRGTTVADVRLPSRGSYSQPVAPTVQATNAHAQGRLAQPKTSKQYIVQNQSPPNEHMFPQPPSGRRGSRQVPSEPAQAPVQAPPGQDQKRGHKRSNTIGGIGEKIFGRSGSMFGGKSQGSGSRQKPGKSYPPTSMKEPLPVGVTPRPSSESRRPSFSIHRKRSEAEDGSRPRRFSILPASFSFKSFASGSKESQTDMSEDMADPKDFPQPPGSRGPQKMQMAFGRGESPSVSSEDSLGRGYDGHYDGQIQQNHEVDPHDRSEQPVSGQLGVPNHGEPHDDHSMDHATGYADHSYLQSETPPLTKSRTAATNPSSFNPIHEDGFNSYEDHSRLPVPQNRPGDRSSRVLQKNNRKFADAYENEHHGHHSGSSGAARRVMDFFSRRRKARASDE
ncbi:MAG: hypothetical protein M1834_005645 [Cirrosporium novae-zelandiae]|nr:MAG: hypothetical protein M1834_005645 [Cirrosporium novae-zelandiae]